MFLSLPRLAPVGGLDGEAAMRCCKANYAICVKINMPASGKRGEAAKRGDWIVYAVTMRIPRNKWLDTSRSHGIIIFTKRLTIREVQMSEKDPKLAALRQQGTLNPRSREVTDPLFAEDSFFDARDLVQVKYEMLRRVQSESHSVTSAATAFGFSRPSFYQALSAFQEAGLAGLVPHKRGPKRAHKLTDELLAFIVATRQKEPAVRTPELVRLLQERFGTKVHPRSIERSLLRRQKKLR